MIITNITKNTISQKVNKKQSILMFNLHVNRNKKLYLFSGVLGAMLYIKKSAEKWIHSVLFIC